jgi:hypothetical protein
VLHELYDAMGSKPVKVDLDRFAPVGIKRQENPKFSTTMFAGNPAKQYGKPMSWVTGCKIFLAEPRLP